MADDLPCSLVERALDLLEATMPAGPERDALATLVFAGRYDVLREEQKRAVARRVADLKAREGYRPFPARVKAGKEFGFAEATLRSWGL